MDRKPGIPVVGLVTSAVLFAVTGLRANSACSQGLVIEEGQARADIVIAERPARGARLAAAELQYYLERIGGAEVPLVHRPSEAFPSHIYVGASEHTARLGIAADSLRYDAFRMVAGDRWLVLLGRDDEFGEPMPFGRGGGRYAGFSLAEDDGRGSLNAVYEYLRGLGCRWYFPGEIGEIVPAMKTISFPEMDRTVRPDFALRQMYQYYNMFHNTRSDEEILWQLRQGFNSGREVLGTTRGHGINAVHQGEAVRKEHPEWFALWGGQRAFSGTGAPCLSSEGLFAANLAYVRSMFDQDEPMVSVAPADGYASLCQCELCRGKDTPERGWNGLLSDYVWEYVDRVAAEAYRTHPGKMITCIAYSTYLLPPREIARLSPNIAVILCRWRSDFIQPGVRDRFSDLLASWLEKTPSGKVFIWDYYLHGRPDGVYSGIPVFFPHLIAEDLKFLEDKSGGEFIECFRNYPEWGLPWHALACNHLNVYVTGRMWWDADQDVDALLEEYYRTFYGPAAAPMKAFVEYSEQNWPRALKEATAIDRFVELLEVAKAAAGPSIYGQRIDLISRYIQPLVARRAEVDKGRADAPVAVAARRADFPLELDGKLDDRLWEGVTVYPLRELIGGGAPDHATDFRIACTDHFLYFGVRCAEADMQSLNVGTTRSEDTNIWNGDTVELMLETPTHAYYQVVVNPAAAIMDVDWKEDFDTVWSSGAVAAAHLGAGFWSLEVRIPIAGEGQERVEPDQGVSGAPPSEADAWYFNVCRQRQRGDTRELSGFSPTGSGFLQPGRFGKLIAR